MSAREGRGKRGMQGWRKGCKGNQEGRRARGVDGRMEGGKEDDIERCITGFSDDTGHISHKKESVPDL